MDSKQRLVAINNNPNWIFLISIITIIGAVLAVIGLIPIISESKTTQDMIHTILMSPIFYFILAQIAIIIQLNKSRIANNKLVKYCSNLDANDVLLREKIVALKTFRDAEMVHYADHTNAQLATFEIRMQTIQDKLKDNNIEISLVGKPENKDPNDIRNEKQNEAAWVEKTKAYNAVFKGWTIGDDYGTGNLQTIYKGKEFKV